MAATASQSVFDRDLGLINSKLQALGAVVTDEDGFTFVDEEKAPATLLRSYRRLVQYGYANGLL